MTQTTHEKIAQLQKVGNELHDLCKEFFEDADKLKEEIELEAVREARDKVEERIRKELGGKMHTVSKIKTYQVGNETVLLLDDVLDLCREMKMKYRKGTEKGYICEDEHARIHAFLALNHLQSTLLSDELSKVDTIEEHKAIIEKHAHHNRNKED